MIKWVSGRNWNNSKIGRRAAAVFTCVLVVLLLVGIMCIQTTQTLLIIRRSDMERTKLYQAREVIELGRQVDWQSAPSASLKLAIPQSVTQDSEPETYMAEIEGLRGGADAARVERIIVHYPLEKPGKITVSWERIDE